MQGHLILGGDHSLAAGSVSASAARARGQNESIALLWIDAHGDMNTPATSLSGNVHGMPLAALLGGRAVALGPGVYTVAVDDLARAARLSRARCGIHLGVTSA